MRQSLGLKKCSNTKRQSQNGVFLIEMALIVIVLGFATVISIPLYKSFVERNALIETEKRMDIIARAISSYAQNRWRLPCPADSGVPVTGSLYGVERTSCSAAVSDRHGIVPYRTLGVPEQYAKDLYGNFFTYVVAQDFTTDNRLGVSADNVHRRLAHLVAGDITNGNYALLPRAQFCAPINANFSRDIRVTQDGNDLYTKPRDSAIVTPRSTTGIPDANLSYREDNVTAVAVALISHGSNGFGAYQPNGTRAPIASGGAAELTNRTRNRIVETENSRSESGPDTYDDIVKFYTQDDIYSIAGNVSCEHL